MSTIKCNLDKVHFWTPPTTFICMQKFSGGQNFSFTALLACYRESPLITISPNKCQMRVLTRTKRYCSIVNTFYGSSQHQFFIFDFLFCTRYPRYSDFLLACVSETVCIKRNNNNTKLCRMKDRRMRSWLVYDYNNT